jgi:hypothetical protein
MIVITDLGFYEKLLDPLVRMTGRTEDPDEVQDALFREISQCSRSTFIATYHH